jgi:PAS domain S-box-containing protein
MRYKLLFLDTNHSLSAVAAHLAQDYSNENLEITSAGLYSEVHSEMTREALNRMQIPAFNRVMFESISRQRFDLVIVLGSLTSEQWPLFQGVPPVIHWKISDPQDGEWARWQQFSTELRMHLQSLFEQGFLKAFQRQRICLGNVLDSLQEGIIAHDLNRKIFLFNSGAEQITGVTRTQILGKDCHEIFSPHICGDNCIFNDCKVLTEINRSNYPTVFTGGQGRRKELDINRFPLKDENGQTIGAVAVISDTTRLRELEMQLGEAESFEGIIGQDYSMQTVFQMIRDLAISDFPVVITGESGTGKELVAAAIHKESDRRDKIFLAVNCGALPEGTLESELFGHVKGAFTGAIKDKKGRFELADKGTLFLDEIAELSPRMQVKLLRVLQEGVVEPVGSETHKRVDVRIICATNRNLREMVNRGEFRKDLYYRLAVVPIEVPHLRERRSDIVLLARHFLARTAKKLSRSEMTLSEDTIAVLMNYSWPGNVRQLQNVIQFAMIKCRGKTIMPEHLPPEILNNTSVMLTGNGGARVGRKPKLTAAMVESALTKAGGNKAKAARILKVGRATLYNFLNNNSEVLVEAESE